MRSRPGIAIIAFFLACYGQPVEAQVKTDIRTDGTLGAKVPVSGPQAEIPASLGRRAGKNLFHSFERFNVGTGDSATFTGPSGLDNVISRVTGGERSAIDGRLASQIPAADFWFINPAGLAFGPNASLDVPASFHVSTADELRFPDGKVFSATEPAKSVLSVAPPEAFGFLGAKTAGIEVNGSQLGAGGLSLVGGQIDIKNDALLVSIDAPLSLVAIAGPGTVYTRGEISSNTRDDITLNEGSATALSINKAADVRTYAGNLILNDAIILAVNADVEGGDLNVNAESIQLRKGAALASRVVGSGHGGDINLASKLVAIDSNGNVRTTSAGDGDAGSISVKADKTIIRGPNQFDEDNPTGITSTSRADKSGGAGTITITVDGQLLITDYGVISSSTQNAKDAGLVKVHADQLTMLSVQRDVSPKGGGVKAFPMIQAIAFDGSKGNAGGVEVLARAIEMRGGIISTSTLAGAPSHLFLGRRDGIPDSTGDAGRVFVKANSIDLAEGAQIRSSASGLGNGGDVTVKSDGKIHLTGKDAAGNPSGIFATAGDFNLVPGRSSAHGGRVTIKAPSLVLQDGARVSSLSLQRGDAGSIEITTDKMILENSNISAEALRGEGGGGQIVIRAGQLVQLRKGEITTTVYGRADSTAGDITIDPEFVVLDNSKIIAQAIEGRGGNIRINADNIVRSQDSAIDASSQLGIDGTVAVSTPEADVTSGLVVLPAAFLDAASRLRDSCAVRGGAEASRFSRAGRTLPPGPGDPQVVSYASAGDADTGAAAETDTFAEAPGALMIACGPPRP